MHKNVFLYFILTQSAPAGQSFSSAQKKFKIQTSTCEVMSENHVSVWICHVLQLKDQESY